MRYEDEFPVAYGPTKSSYSPGDEQAQRMEGHLGPELNRQITIMVAKLEIIETFRQRYNKERLNTAFIGVDKIMGMLAALEQEIKAELK